MTPGHITTLSHVGFTQFQRCCGKNGKCLLLLCYFSVVLTYLSKGMRHTCTHLQCYTTVPTVIVVSCQTLHICVTFTEWCCDVAFVTQAKERGILFMPAPNQRRQDGKTVYRYGNATVYLEQGVVFVQRGSEWVPMSLSNMNEMS